MKISRNAEQSHLFLISSTIRGNGALFNQCSAGVKTHYRMAHFTQLFFQEKEQRPLKEGVQDMLVKHHLFSWDIDG